MFKIRFLMPMLFGFMLLCHGQKLVQKRILNPFTKVITIDSKNCFQVDLNTDDSKELKVEAVFEGEYQKDLSVNIQEEGDNVLISTSFNPNFSHPNDKLSAHKVVSIALKITVPKDLKVRLYGTSTHVNASGKFDNLDVTLSDGDCTLSNISEHVSVKTQTGMIHLNTNSGAVVAESTYGKTTVEEIPSGNTTYELKSVQGNIFVNRTE